MTLAELRQLIAAENARLRAKYPQSSTDDEKWALAQAVKMTEELGELCAELLGSFKLQRSDHPTMEDSSRGRLSDEFADVVITTLLAAETMGVDIDQALARKLERIKQRHKQSRV